ncbi:hypothetical protein ACFYO1_02390 [Nocardia sp. NPDC006044]|uniref:WXG100-like domain-containing protein n=1 Tax=Nocardia sp. NPDC006044 TaxID=3364306 RepID=UPI0036A95EF8
MLELPHEVAFFLNFVGVQYPDINEDDVRALAQHMRQFTQNVNETHDSATQLIKDMNSFYSGYSYNQLVAAWGAMSATHMAELDRVCKLVAGALEVAADVILAVKIAVIAQLAAMTVSFITILATPGMGLMTPALAAAARRVCTQMEQSVIGYVVAEVIGKAIEPFEHAIDDMIKGLVYRAVMPEDGQAPAHSAAETLHIEPDEVLRSADMLDSYADEILQHANKFAADVSALDFATPGSRSEISITPGDYQMPLLRRPLELPRIGGADVPVAVVDAPNAVPSSADANDVHAAYASPPIVDAAAHQAALQSVDRGWPPGTSASGNNAADSTAPSETVPTRSWPPSSSVGSASGDDVLRSTSEPIVPGDGPGSDPASDASPDRVSETASTKSPDPHADSVSSAATVTAAPPTRPGEIQAGHDDSASASGPAAPAQPRDGMTGSPPGSAPRQPDARGGSPTPASPWARSGRLPAATTSAPKATSAPKVVPPKVLPPAVSAPERESLATPWSKPDRAKNVPSRVFVPTAAEAHRTGPINKTTEDCEAELENSAEETESKTARPAVIAPAVPVAPRPTA